MVRNSIKVFARIKNEQCKKTWQYSIRHKEDYEDIRFYHSNVEVNPCLKQEQYQFRFHKVFDQHSSQVDIFENMARPVVNSALNGYNGTIFAYGQTGSGKTYAITGSSVDYNGRGVIPRSIQHIFSNINMSPDAFTIHVSYMEIYKEVGYDLLNPRQKACRLEDLPRVVLLEDAKGESHLRNLSVLPVSTEQEAMRLLFLGDTNRTIAETPMNEYSSRSHCIFTVYVTAKNSKSGKVRRSKLHLVDLAGSERVHKTRVSGSTLSEAKQINLSLHYLEQVILALSQSKRCHVPYRNSMMTYMLRDSLSGNCLTIMLATMAVNDQNIRETVSTCRFAQRVAMMCTEAKINEEVDPNQEIGMLRDEVQELRRQLSLLKGITVDDPLTKDQEKYCRNAVRKFLNNNTDELLIDSDLRQVHLCFQLLKKAIFNQQNEKENFHNETLAKFKDVIKKKDEEIAKLKQKLETAATQPLPMKPSENGIATSISNMDETEREIFNMFVSDPSNTSEITYFNKKLAEKYDIARKFAGTVESCQVNIKELRQQLQKVDEAMKVKLNTHLMSQQTMYREALLRLENVKKETDHLKHGLQQAQIKLMKQFQRWKNQSVDIVTDGSLLQVKPKEKSGTEEAIDDECSLATLTTPRHLSNSENSYNEEAASAPEENLAESSSESISLSKSGESYCVVTEDVVSEEPEKDVPSKNPKPSKSLYKSTDTPSFMEFMKTVPLTGDDEVDDEIFNFYRSKFNL